MTRRPLIRPLSRLRSIEKEASTLQSEINTLRGKLDRSEKYESSEIDQLEITVADLQTRADAVLVETARGTCESRIKRRKSRAK